MRGAAKTEDGFRRLAPHVTFGFHLANRRRVALFDHLADVAALLGQPRFAETLNHQLCIY